MLFIPLKQYPSDCSRKSDIVLGQSQNYEIKKAVDIPVDAYPNYGRSSGTVAVFPGFWLICQVSPEKIPDLPFGVER